ncbi:MAG: DMT family transporter [Methyloprofundus sp.]|nr:DMT family transporter [Methyloprofundus sp.]
MDKTSGRWQLGILLSLTTALFWGALPIALKGLLESMDTVTVTWFRFLIATLCVGSYRFYKVGLPNQKQLNGSLLGLLLIAVAGLTVNYLFYLMGLETITPSSAQIVIQLAPMLLLLGSLIFFKERFNWRQWLGLLLFITGLGLFFNQRLYELLSELSQYTIGVIYIVIAAFTWAAYALAQKQLLKNFKSADIMLLIYITGSFLFFPNSQLTLALELDGLGWALLIFCSINTIIAYGSFAEALDHLEASRVSAILAITPLLTIIFTQITNHLFPGYIIIETLNLLSIIGALMIVLGSMITALSKHVTHETFDPDPTVHAKS